MIDSIALACFEKTGLYPISFCLPKKRLRPFCNVSKQKDLSFIVPGDLKTFVFNDEDSYMREYQESRFAITKKKGGWDCVRHLEIMAASALPLFENIENCPDFTLAHYPKKIFQEINEGYHSWSPSDYDSYLRKVYTWFENHLTSEKMAQYMLRITTNENVKNVLFIDKSLPTKPDCLSAMILGGLKEIFQDRCEVAYPLDCLYKDRPIPKKPKWWKTNFNIYQIFDESYRSQNERVFNIKRIQDQIKTKKYDLIVYGSLTRSLDLFTLVQTYFSKERVLAVNGDDSYTNKKPTLEKSIKLWLRQRFRQAEFSGPFVNSFLSDKQQWLELKRKIEPHCTLFMREITTTV